MPSADKNAPAVSVNRADLADSRGAGEGEVLLDLPADAMLRARRPGDRIGLPGGRHKKLHDAYIDAKIPQRRREGAPVLASGREVLWTPLLVREPAVDAGAGGVPRVAVPFAMAPCAEAMESHRPSTIDHRPSTIDHRPSTIDHRPPHHRPPTVDHRRSARLNLTSHERIATMAVTTEDRRVMRGPRPVASPMCEVVSTPDEAHSRAGPHGRTPS